ncbi:MAG: ADP-ribosyltransferase [Thiobacillus sp.]|nr:ADP-ribosyltransferase [Bellilinea sp.]
MPNLFPCLPNPDSSTDPNWRLFTKYLKDYNIAEANDPAIDAYQSSNSSPYLSASQLNHCLALRYFGATGKYADLAREQYGDSEEDWGPQASLGRLDKLFSESSYRFAVESVVFKGIGSEPFYEVLDLPNRTVGEIITFPGFLSTSVCREKAVSFARGQYRILLEITGLEQVDVIVPPNKCVSNSPTPNIPEQEILLNREISFRIVSKTDDGHGFHQIGIKAHGV